MCDYLNWVIFGFFKFRQARHQFLNALYLDLRELMKDTLTSMLFLKIGLQQFPASHLLWLEYLQTASGDSDWLQNVETHDLEIDQALEATKFHFSNSTQIFDLAKILYETLGDVEKIEKITLKQLELPHDKFEETLGCLTGDLPSKLPKQHVQDKLRRCENDAVKMEGWKCPEDSEHVDPKVAWEFSIGWMNYANSLNTVLKQIQVGTVLAPFERAVCCADSIKIKYFHEQFWIVYLNHVTYSKMLSDKEKEFSKLQILKQVTSYCPWYGNFWVMLFKQSLKTEPDNFSPDNILKRAMEQEIEQSSHVVDLLHCYADFTGDFTKTYDCLEKLEEYYPHQVDSKLKLKSKFLALDYEGKIPQLEIRKNRRGGHSELFSELFNKILKTPVGKSAKFWLEQIVEDSISLDRALEKIEAGYNDEFCHYAYSVLHLAEVNGYSEKADRLRNELKKLEKKRNVIKKAVMSTNARPLVADNRTVSSKDVMGSFSTENRYKINNIDDKLVKTFEKITDRKQENQRTNETEHIREKRQIDKKLNDEPVAKKAKLEPVIVMDISEAEKKLVTSEPSVTSNQVPKPLTPEISKENLETSSEKTPEEETPATPKFKAFLSNISRTIEFPKNVIERWFTSIKINAVEIDLAFNGVKFRGFAIATLTSKEDLEKTLENDRKQMEDNRSLYVSPYNEEEQGKNRTKAGKKIKGPGGKVKDAAGSDPRIFKFSKGEEISKVYVSGLKTENSRNEGNLRALFSNLKSIRIPTNKSGTENKPFAYVEFETPDEAKEACEKHHETEFYGVTIKVLISKPPAKLAGNAKKQEDRKAKIHQPYGKGKRKAATENDGDAGNSLDEKSEGVPDQKTDKKTKRPIVMFMPRSLN